MLLEDDASPLHIPAVGAQQAVDVTGAGDTVIATFALACSSYRSPGTEPPTPSGPVVTEPPENPVG